MHVSCRSSGLGRPDEDAAVGADAGAGGGEPREGELPRHFQGDGSFKWRQQVGGRSKRSRYVRRLLSEYPAFGVRLSENVAFQNVLNVPAALFRRLRTATAFGREGRRCDRNNPPQADVTRRGACLCEDKTKSKTEPPHIGDGTPWAQTVVHTVM